MEFRLQKGAHPSPFDEEGNWQGCAMEFGAYLAGLEHTDRPACVSPVLLSLMIGFNDYMDADTRQKLRPYIVRTLGSAGDGQDKTRGFMAADWAVRECAAIALAAAGFNEQAQALQNLTPIVDAFSARAARAAAARAAAARAAADAGAYASAASAATYAAATYARAAANAAGAASAAATYARAAANAAGAASAASAASAAVWQSALGLLDRIIDPGGIHDVRTEGQWLSAGSPKVRTV